MSNANSPYGPIYLNSIKKKLEPGEKGIFILSVDPWGISSTSDDPNNTSQFRENDRFLETTKNVNQDPNYEYLIENYKGKYLSILINRSSKMLLHQNGWLEVKVKMTSEKVKNRLNDKVKTYKGLISKYQFSNVRYNYLLKTIDYLNKYGDVYLVRLPVHTKMMNIENSYMPDFSKKNTKCCRKKRWLFGSYNI